MYAVMRVLLKFCVCCTDTMWLQFYIKPTQQKMLHIRITEINYKRYSLRLTTEQKKCCNKKNKTRWKNQCDSQKLII